MNGKWWKYFPSLAISLQHASSCFPQLLYLLSYFAGTTCTFPLEIPSQKYTKIKQKHVNGFIPSLLWGFHKTWRKLSGLLFFPHFLFLLLSILGPLSFLLFGWLVVGVNLLCCSVNLYGLNYSESVRLKILEFASMWKQNKTNKQKPTKQKNHKPINVWTKITRCVPKFHWTIFFTLSFSFTSLTSCMCCTCPLHENVKLWKLIGMSGNVRHVSTTGIITRSCQVSHSVTLLHPVFFCICLLLVWYPPFCPSLLLYFLLLFEKMLLGFLYLCFQDKPHWSWWGARI